MNESECAAECWSGSAYAVTLLPGDPLLTSCFEVPGIVLEGHTLFIESGSVTFSQRDKRIKFTSDSGYAFWRGFGDYRKIAKGKLSLSKECSKPN